jgi:hypothetical protein
VIIAVTQIFIIYIFFILNINLYFIKIYVNRDWKLRNIASDIEEKRIEMTVVDVEKGEKRK